MLPPISTSAMMRSINFLLAYKRWVITTLLLKSAYYYKGIRYPFGSTYVVSKMLQ
jgi:hypothetical protein